MSGAYFYRTFASKASLSENAHFPKSGFFNRIRTKLQLDFVRRSDEAGSAIIVLETQADFRSRHKKGRHEWHPSGSENQY
jgi:hypothetical protein